MDLVFVCEGRFVRNRVDGNVYDVVGGGFFTTLWERYLRVFDHIYILARVSYDCEIHCKPECLASGDRVSFIDLPYYVGPFQYLVVQQAFRKVIDDATISGRCYICRVPGQVGNIVAAHLHRKKIPYGVEVVGDPWDVFASGAVQHPLRLFFRYKGWYDLRKNVLRSSAALFVTKKSLQKRYPIRDSSFQVVASNVQLHENYLPKRAKALDKKMCYNLISVGSLDQMYKAPDIVIKALQLLKERNISVHLTWLGDGKYKSEMKDFAKCLNVQEMITFSGNVSPEDVRKHLLDADLFILASRTEGLPRAMVEAMAFGLPCIGSNVGGIPELLEKEVLVPKDNESVLADKIEYMINNLNYSNQQAQRNFGEAKDYYDSILKKQRERFYRHLVCLIK